MSDPKVIPQTAAEIARALEKQTEYIEQFKIKEIPACLEGLADENYSD